MSDGSSKKVREILRKAFAIDPHLVSFDMSPNDIPSWDSVGHLSLGSLLEEGFEIRLDVDDLSEMDSVAAIIHIVERRRSFPEMNDVAVHD